jgi:hypothetical protein
VVELGYLCVRLREVMTREVTGITGDFLRNPTLPSKEMFGYGSVASM